MTGAMTAEREVPMNLLQVRKPPFTFEGVEFHWNPANPAFSVFVNAMSFWVIGLEHYLVRTMRAADPHITDAAVRAEARSFVQQEAVHARAHRRHVNALIDQHPGLQRALDLVIARYDELYEERDLRFHLAYSAGLEGTFTPVFGGFIDHREALFSDGDARVASLCLWHFCEEIEHRSSAANVYAHLVDDHRYKRRVFPVMVAHVDRGFEALLGTFQAAVPGEAGADHYGSRAARLLGRSANPHAAIPLGARIQMAWRGIASLRSGFDHLDQPIPAWADSWFASFDAGADMTRFYGTVIDAPSAVNP
jgi:predicted metal-dependent hydrolase